MNLLPNEDLMRLADKEEPRFLSILLRDKECLSDAISMGFRSANEEEKDKRPGHFLYPKNDLLFGIIKKYYLKFGSLLTRSAMDSVVDMQTGFGTEEDRAAIKGYWDKVWNRHDVTVEDYSMLKDHINDRFLLRQFYDIWRNGDQIIKATSNHSDLLKKFVTNINGMENMSPDPYSLTMGINEGMTEAMKYIEDRRDNQDSSDTVLSGIGKIDDIFHGFARGSYTVVSGMINGGKTTLLMNIAFNMAKAGHNVAYVSLEKDAKLFFRRTLARHAMTDYNRIKTGGTGQWGLSDYWFRKLQDAAKDLTDNIKPNYHCLQFVQDTVLTKILSALDKLRSQRKLDVIVVDYLQVIGVETRTIGRPDLDLANVHKRLMAYGRTHGIVIFTALQLKSSSSKEIRKKVDKVVSEAEISSVSVNTEDYAGSQMVVADADNALGVVLNGDKPPTKMFISFSKARDDESRRTISLDFDGKVGLVCDPEFNTEKTSAVEKNEETIAERTIDLVYDEKMTPEILGSDDDLFDTMEKKQETKKIEKENISEIINTTDTTDTTSTAIYNEIGKNECNEDIVDSASFTTTNIKGIELSEKPVNDDGLDFLN
jgi:replicative DNA helicase